MTDLAVIGRATPKKDGADKVTGRTRFLHDLELPGPARGCDLAEAGTPEARVGIAPLRSVGYAVSLQPQLQVLLFRYVECLQSYPKEITELKNEIDRLRDVLCFYLPTVQKIEAGSRQAGTGQGIPDGALFDARCCRVSVAGTAGMPSTARRIRQLIGTV